MRCKNLLSCLRIIKLCWWQKIWIRNLLLECALAVDSAPFLHSPYQRAHTKFVHFFFIGVLFSLFFGDFGYFFFCSLRLKLYLRVLQMSTFFFLLSIRTKKKNGEEWKRKKKKKSYTHDSGDYNTKTKTRIGIIHRSESASDIIVYECFVFVHTLTHAIPKWTAEKNRSFESAFGFALTAMAHRQELQAKYALNDNEATETVFFFSSYFSSDSCRFICTYVKQ